MPRLTLERAALISSAALLMLLCAITVYTRYVSNLSPVWKRVSYISTQGKIEQSSLPLVLPEAPLQAVVQIQFSLSETHSNRFYFWQDDCISSLYVNAASIALPEVPFCDYERGLPVDLSNIVHPGDNTLSVTLQNRGGPGGLNIVPAGSDRLIRRARLLTIVFALLMTALVVLTWGAITNEELRRLRATPMIITALEWSALGIALCGAVAIRWLAFPYESIDIKDFVRPWLEFILTHGRMASHEVGFSNYAPLYLYLLSIFSPLTHWLPAIAVIKLISVIGDIFLALGVIRVLSVLAPTGSRAECAGVVVLFLPTVWLNSSMWGQVDSLYTAALVWSFYHLLRRQNLLCCACFGTALSFKFQALFFAPLFACGWALAANPIWPLLCAPAFFIASLLPAWLAGRPFLDLILVYGRQAGSYTELTKGAPTLYAWLPNHLYNLFYPMGMVFAVSILALVWVLLSRSKRSGSADIMALLALASVITTPFLLPKMHDRYFFPADIFALIVAFAIPRFFWIAITTQIASLASYTPFLFGQTIMTTQSAALIQLFNVVMILYTAFRAICHAPSSQSSQPDDSDPNGRTPISDENQAAATSP